MAPDDKKKKQLPSEKWKLHDYYDKQLSYGCVLTRSQTPFVRIKNTDSDMALFMNGVLHHPSTRPHLLVSMCGEHGAIPKTVITRSAAKELELDENLLKILNDYKKLTKTDPLIKELKEYQKEHPNLLNPGATVEEVEIPPTSAESDGQSSAERSSSGYESSDAGRTSGSESSA